MLSLAELSTTQSKKHDKNDIETGTSNLQFNMKFDRNHTREIDVPFVVNSQNKMIPFSFLYTNK